MYIYIYIYIYIFVCVFVCVCVCVYVCNHKDNVPSRLSPQWLICLGKKITDRQEDEKRAATLYT